MSIVAVDDFDPLIAYSNDADWKTPNPQDHPTWWNETSEVTGVPWYEATYHYTEVQRAIAYFNFTGSSIAIYGASGPDEAKYTIKIDPQLSQPFSQSFTTANATGNGRTLLYSSDQLAYASHQVQIINEGSGLLLDVIEVGSELSAEGGSYTNVTVQDNDSNIQYSGDWTEQSGPNFSGGTSHYTQGPGNSFTYSFEGSAIWIHGDQVDDHGPYSVSINDTMTQTYSGRSGCGEASYAKYCEKLHGLIGFFGGLPQGTHTVKLENLGPSDENRTFVDFDYLIYAKPDQYPNLNIAQSPACPFTNCDGSSGSPSGSASASVSASSSQSPSSSGSGAPTTTSGAAAMAMENGLGQTFLLASFIGALFVRWL